MIENYVNTEIEKTVVIDFSGNKAKTLIEIGYIKIYLKNHFNWFQKKMWKLILGIKITDIKESKEK